MRKHPEWCLESSAAIKLVECTDSIPVTQHTKTKQAHKTKPPHSFLQVQHKCARKSPVTHVCFSGFWGAGKRLFVTHIVKNLDYNTPKWIFCLFIKVPTSRARIEG
jgi:hypothetical protein